MQLQLQAMATRRHSWRTSTISWTPVRLATDWKERCLVALFNPWPHSIWWYASVASTIFGYEHIIKYPILWIWAIAIAFFWAPKDISEQVPNLFAPDEVEQAGWPFWMFSLRADFSISSSCFRLVLNTPEWWVGLGIRLWPNIQRLRLHWPMSP